MLDRLMISNVRLEEVVHFVIRGVHFEKYGAANQPWDNKVAQAVDDVWKQTTPAQGTCEWYALYLRWFVMPEYPRQDLDNLRLKPILDSLTRKHLWPDDDVRYIRAIYSEAVLVTDASDQHVEVLGKAKL
jgi:Holliday junction resolvase RusA-like endonuclease